MIVAAALAAGATLWLMLNRNMTVKITSMIYGLIRKHASAGGTEAPVQADNRKSGAIHYDEYRLSIKQKIGSSAAAALVLFFIGLLFYKHPAAGIVISLFGLLYPRLYRRLLIRRRKDELNRQFKQALYAISSSLSAGKSVENAFQDAAVDMRLLYRDERVYIVDELERIGRKLENGETIERALLDFAGRAGLEDIRNFCDVVSTCKRSGGNLMKVVRRTSDMIGEKMELQQEIIVLLAQKRFESKVLICAPAAVVALLGLSSPDYMAPLYGNPAGIAIMSFALVMLIGAGALTSKLMNIKV